MHNFITCPFCAGGEKVSPLAASIIREAIALHLHRWRSTLPEPVLCELENICNAIQNREERTTAIDVDPLLA